MDTYTKSDLLDRKRRVVTLTSTVSGKSLSFLFLPKKDNRGQDCLHIYAKHTANRYLYFGCLYSSGIFIKSHNCKNRLYCAYKAFEWVCRSIFRNNIRNLSYVSITEEVQ